MVFRNILATASSKSVIPTVTSTEFTFNSQTCLIRNQANSTKLQVVSVDGSVEVDNIGSYGTTTGIVSIVGLNPQAFEGTQITLSTTPANQNTIRPLRNYVIDIDPALSSSRAILDFQNTSMSI